VEFDGPSQRAIRAEPLQHGEREVAGSAGSAQRPMEDDLHRRGDLEPGAPALEGEGNVLIAHSLPESAYGAEDVEVTVGADEGVAGVHQALFDGDVRADAGVHVVDPNALTARPLTAELLIVGVGDVARRRDQVEGEESARRIRNGGVAVVLAVVLHHVRPAEIPRRAHIQIEPDDVARLDRRLGRGVRREQLLNHCFAHKLPIPTCYPPACRSRLWKCIKSA